MKHERGIVDLWGWRIPLYWSPMTKMLYNLRLLGDQPMSGGAFDAFMDGFGASMDMFPACKYPGKARSADKLWADFVRVALDANKGFEKAKMVASVAARTNHHIESRNDPAPLRKVSAG